MAVKLVNRKWCPCMGAYQYDYIVDTEDDVSSLPKCCTGSSALVVESGNVYVVNASDNWVLYGG